MASAEEEGRRLFVGGLNGATTDATFRAHFASFFPVANAEVSKHIYVSNPSIILRFTGTPTKSSKYKQARKLQATLVWNYDPLTRWRGWSVELLA